VQHGVYAFGVLSVSLLIGTTGFHLLARQPLIDALLNSAMLLGGMGPVGAIESTPGKLFASIFALYAGLVFPGRRARSYWAPFLHRFLHRFHLEEEKRRESRRHQ
jgi:hypothetical protein